MSQSSDLSSKVSRRVPRQARAERTVSTLLDAAATEFDEVGYDAATLTAIAARAGIAIGSLYQYFPDKSAVALALADRYRTAMIERLTPLLAEAADLKTDRLVARMFDVMIKLIAERPAFLPLVTAPVDYSRHKEGRSRLRNLIASVLRAHQPRLAAPEAARMAVVTIQLFKGMHRAFDEQTDAERQALAREFNLVLLAYFKSKLRD
jgi:AcrR family transcriptional regulator